MRRSLSLTIVLSLAACTAPSPTPARPSASSPTATPSQVTPEATVDDGSYLARIDPLGGQWQVERLGEADVRRFKPWVAFSGGGFFNHGAGCGGGHPAFYELAGDRVTVTRREAIQVGKCSPTREMVRASAAERAAAAASERQVATFLDRAARWSQPDASTLLLTASDGATAVLSRPVEPHPEIAGRWRIDSIGGAPLPTERRPATAVIGMGSIGASADCNSMGTPFTVPVPGRIAVQGPIVSTAIGCAPEDAAEDDLMARAITQATGYVRTGERLVISGGPGMVLTRFPGPNRAFVGEYEAAGNTLLGAYHEGPITLVVTADTLRDSAGCVARYRANGPHLSLALEASAACDDPSPPYVPAEPVSIGGDISLLAVGRPDGFAFDDTGMLVLHTNRGLLTMRRRGDPPPFGS